ncbi:MAG: OmpA family protein [candidate division Zixibacteria bacterium]|nr:OmpA family protein [candidate division Zixibacteria bacterium]
MKKLLPVIGLVVLMLLAGCGASKQYVDNAVSEERARSQSSVDNLKKSVDGNKAAVERLQSLTAQLETKTDMAINEAKGFENYQVIWEGEIFFDFNSTDLNSAALDIIDQAGDKMTADRGTVMEIAGYTDPSGGSKYNLELGNKRSAAAKYYLVDSYGVNLYRVFIVSHGENKAMAAEDGKISYAKQRKVKMKLWGKM